MEVEFVSITLVNAILLINIIILLVQECPVKIHTIQNFSFEIENVLFLCVLVCKSAEWIWLN